MTPRTTQGVLWVASYPKSGNTWLRSLLMPLLFQPPRSSVDLERFMPNLGGVPGEQVHMSPGAPCVLKTHWTYMAANPAFRETLGIVFVVRNPLDVMMSFFNFNVLRQLRSSRSLSEQEVREARSQYVDTFIAHRGNPLRVQGAGHTDWVSCVAGWLQALSEHPGIMIRYEDLKDDALGETRRVATFLRQATSDDALRTVVEGASFESMKAMEEREIRDQEVGFFYRPEFEQAHASGIRFMHRGRVGQEEAMPLARQRRAFHDAFGGTLERLGYSFEADTGRIVVAPSPLRRVRPLDAAANFGESRVIPPG